MNDNARARTAAITATLEHLAWFKTPHTLDQIVGLHLEALGAGTMTFRYGATPGEMAATIKARAETGPAGRIGPPNPDASGRAAATHETLFGIDTTTADLAAYGRQLDDLCAQTLGLELRPRHPDRTRQSAIANTVAAILHARPNIEPAAALLPAHELGHLDDLIRCHLADAAAWLHTKAEAIWATSHGERQPVAVQRALRYCESCHRWGIEELVDRYANRCRRCGQFKVDHGVEPTERICRMWHQGINRVTPGMILEAKSAAKSGRRNHRSA